MHHPANFRHVPVDIGVSCRIRGRSKPAIVVVKHLTLQVTHHHVGILHALIGHTGSLNHKQVCARHTFRYVPGGPNHQRPGR